MFNIVSGHWVYTLSDLQVLVTICWASVYWQDTTTELFETDSQWEYDLAAL